MKWKSERTLKLVNNTVRQLATRNGANGTASISGNTLTYTPSANFNGTDSLTVKANDGELDSAPATISITVDPVNDAPTLADGSLSTDEDTAGGLTLAGSDVENDPLTYTIVTNGTNGTMRHRRMLRNACAVRLARNVPAGWPYVQRFPTFAG